MKEFESVMELENYIVDGNEVIEPGVVGVWAGTKIPIEIKGIFVPTGMFQEMFPRLCVRWLSGTGKGLFGKGIAGYNGKPIKLERLVKLKKVK